MTLSPYRQQTIFWVFQVAEAVPSSPCQDEMGVRGYVLVGFDADYDFDV